MGRMRIFFAALFAHTCIILSEMSNYKMVLHTRPSLCLCSSKVTGNNFTHAEGGPGDEATIHVWPWQTGRYISSKGTERGVKIEYKNEAIAKNGVLGA